MGATSLSQRGFEIPRQESSYLIGTFHLGQFCEDVFEVIVRIQTIGNRCSNQAVENSQRGCTSLGICKQPVFAFYDKSIYFPLADVVINRQATIKQVSGQSFPHDVSSSLNVV